MQKYVACGAHQIIYKGKPDYSPEHVIDELEGLVHAARKIRCNQVGNIEDCDTEDIRRRRIEKRIKTELDLIGIGDNLKGKRYLFEAIYYLIENNVQDAQCSAMKILTKTHKKTHSNLIGVMQTAIHHAWGKCTLSVLEKQYTAIVYNETGVPTVNEFIYYYANKIYSHFE